MKTLQLRGLSKETILLIKQEALKRDVSPSELVRRAVLEYIKKEDKDADAQDCK